MRREGFLDKTLYAKINFTLLISSKSLENEISTNISFQATLKTLVKKNNLTTQDLYNENYKPLLKELKELNK